MFEDKEKEFIKTIEEMQKEINELKSKLSDKK